MPPMEPKRDGRRWLVPHGDEYVPLDSLSRAEQGEWRLAIGPNYDDGDLVFATIEGHVFAPNVVSRQFHDLVKRTNVGAVRFHDLRHTAATLMLKAGVHPKIVSERLGHSTISITLDTYSHVLPDMQRDAAVALDAILAAGR